MTINPLTRNFDLVVIGGGNAGLCAAISAARLGCSVLILEASPIEYRGGNSRHTRNLRCTHSGESAPLIDSYSEDEFLDDLLQVTKGKTDLHLAKLTIAQSALCLKWMTKNGVHFQPSLSGTLSLARTNAFFLGGGKALINAYHRTAASLGVIVVYQAQVTKVTLQKQTVQSITLEHEDTKHSLFPRAVVVASGGFQANLEWLARVWGPAANNFIVRGTPFNKGKVLADLANQGVTTVGDPSQCHAVAIDGRSPQFDGGIVTRLDCVPFSIVVNKNAHRFYDEGEDVWPKRYAIWGRLVARQPQQIGYVIIDSKSIDLYMPSVFPPVQADTISELAEAMGLSPDALTHTVTQFNAACPPSNTFNATALDGLATSGLPIAKTNWARPISQPPFYGYTIRPGVTFTYWGLQVDATARCSNTNGPIKNLWAAGETMAGSILGQGYLAGFGMTIGTVFGRIAGEQVAEYVQKNH